MLLDALYRYPTITGQRTDKGDKMYQNIESLVTDHAKHLFFILFTPATAYRARSMPVDQGVSGQDVRVSRHEAPSFSSHSADIRVSSEQIVKCAGLILQGLL